MYIFNDTNYNVNLNYYVDTSFRGSENVFEDNDFSGNTMMGPDTTFEIQDVRSSDNISFTIPTRDQLGEIFSCTYRYYIDSFKPTIRVSTILSNCGGGNVESGFLV